MEMRSVSMITRYFQGCDWGSTKNTEEMHKQFFSPFMSPEKPIVTFVWVIRGGQVNTNNCMDYSDKHHFYNACPIIFQAALLLCYLLVS